MNRSRRLISSFIVATVIGTAGASRSRAGDLGAGEAKQILNLRGCNACHATDEARIGPPYRAVAFRYAGSGAKQEAEAEDWLAAKILFGGAGSWGIVPMVANPDIPHSEARRIARWILGLERASNEPRPLSPATPRD